MKYSGDQGCMLLVTLARVSSIYGRRFTLQLSYEAWSFYMQLKLYTILCGANNVVEHYGNIIEILHRCPFEGWPNKAWQSHPFLAEIVWLAELAMPCYVSPLKDTRGGFALFIFLDFRTVWERRISSKVANSVTKMNSFAHGGISKNNLCD